MTMLRHCRRAVGVASFVLAALLSSPGAAQTGGGLDLDVSEGRLVRLPGPAATIFVADPAIADIQVPMDDRVFLIGKAPGRTALFALDADGEPIISLPISVVRPVDELQRLIDVTTGGAMVDVVPTPSGAILTGIAPNVGIAASVDELVRAYLGADAVVTNRVSLPTVPQINLRIRIAEVSRTVTKELGFSWDALLATGGLSVGLATGRLGGARPPSARGTAFGSASAEWSSGGDSVLAIIDALAQDGIVSLLAEPNLTVVSGETASFLAGGRFPYPVVQGDGAVSVQYENFGVSLQFTPTVLADGRIRIAVQPEVSELSFAEAPTAGSFAVPTITTRSVNTTVTLASGESFALAGLVRSNTANGVSRLPGLGELPVLGPLFRSTRFRSDEAELIVIATPYLVAPVSTQDSLVLPNDAIVPPSDLERIFTNRVTGGAPSRQRDIVRLLGDAGFIAE